MAQQISPLVSKGDRFMKSGEREKARKSYRRALQKRRDDIAALRRLASLEMDDGNKEEAIPLLRRIADLEPSDFEMRLLLVDTIEDTRDHTTAEETVRLLLGDAPDYGPAHNSLGNILQIQNRSDEALATYQRALELEPESQIISINIGNTLDDLGRHAESIDLYSKALEQQRGFVEARYYRSRALLAVGQPEEAMADIKYCLALAPADQRAIALQGVLHAELGQEEEARRIFDYDRFVRIVRPEAPSGYADMAEFHAAVIDHARNRAALEYDPYGFSTRGGWHSGDLLQDPHETMVALKGMLQNVFQTYRSEFPADQNHPFLRQKYSKFRILAFAQILETQGFLISHIHPGGWVSGAYYLAIPGAIADGAANPGWLEFGRPTPELKSNAKLETRSYQPEEGMAILFPSHFFHGTRPFESDQPRISLGIDMIGLNS